MGKPSKSKAGGPGAASSAASRSSGDPRDASDALSLHTNPETNTFTPFRDEDDDDTLQLAPGLDDLPPSYSDSYTDAPADPTANMPPNDSDNPEGQLYFDFATPYPPVIYDPSTQAQYFIDAAFDNPEELERQIRALAKSPPRPYIQIIGTHTRTVRDSKGKTERKTVTDFDVSIDLTPYLYSNPARRKHHAYIRTVEDYEKVHRGTVLKKRAPGVKHDLEVGLGPKPELKEWCHRYGASSAGLKCFSLRKDVVGFDLSLVREELSRLVRGTNYRGHFEVRFVNKGNTMEMYNEARINRWRLTSWIQWFFTLTFLWIFSWPFLFFCTKRWEVAVVDWPFSHWVEDHSQPNGMRKEYASLSEEQWYNMWARAIRRAIMERRTALLNQRDLAAEQGRGEEPTFRSGNGTVDAIFRAGIGAMNAVNTQMGWGYDEE